MVYRSEKAPHLTIKRTTRGMMLEFLAVISVILVYGICWNFINRGTQYGVNAILIAVVSIVTSVFADALWALPCFWDKKVTSVEDKFKNFGLQILNSYGYVSGVVLALLLPPASRLYAVFICAFIGTFLVKSIFGGFGKNIFNPAIVARLIGAIFFGSDLKTSFTTAVAGDAFAGASFISNISSGGWVNVSYDNVSIVNMILGNYTGAIGETFAFLILAGGIYLVVRKIIDWRIPTFYIGTIFLTTLVMGLFGKYGVNSFEFAFRQVMIGGALLGGIFCLTDPVTSPTSRGGKVIYAVAAALLTCLIRYQASYPEGVAFSILIVNTLTPLIDKMIVGKSNQKIAIKGSVVGAIMVGSMVFGGVYGSLHAIPDIDASLTKILDAQSLTSTLEGEVIKDSLPADGTYASFSKKLSGFTITYNGSAKEAAYYETTCLESAQYTTEDGDKENYGVCALVTADGIIGASDNKSQTMSIGDYCTQFSIAKPYKVATDIDVIVGSTHSLTMVARLFGDILADFGGK